MSSLMVITAAVVLVVTVVMGATVVMVAMVVTEGMAISIPALLKIHQSEAVMVARGDKVATVVMAAKAGLVRVLACTMPVLLRFLAMY